MMAMLNEKDLEEEKLLLGKELAIEHPSRFINTANTSLPRSRCDTPNGYQTSVGRLSSESFKAGMEILPHFGHAKKINVSALNAINSVAKEDSLKRSTQ